MELLSTPYYLIDQDEIDGNYQHLCDALNTSWPNNVIGYSYKTNSLPWVAKHFQDMGCYAEVVSEDEYELCKLLNTTQGQIIYNGPVKSEQSFKEAVCHCNIVNIDSHRELEWLAELNKHSVLSNAKIGLRVNFDIEKYCPGQSACGMDGGRFGFCYENGELEKAIRFLKGNNIKLSGLHLHISSKTREVCIYDAISKVAVEISEKYGLEPEYIDVGGGFFGGMPSKPQFERYFEVVSNNLKRRFDPQNTKLIVEPGMALIGAFAKYVTSVVDVKDTSYNRFVITDGSRTNIDPLMTKSSYQYTIQKDNPRNCHRKQVICGYTCMEHDRLFEITDGEELAVGDRIIYNKVGAYTMCLTPLFISYFPDVYISSGGMTRKIRNHWTAWNYTAECI